MGEDPEWTNWERVSYPMIAAMLEKHCQKKPNNPCFVTFHDRGKWGHSKCQNAYKEWFKTFAPNWPPRVTKGGKRIE